MAKYKKTAFKFNINDGTETVALLEKLLLSGNKIKDVDPGTLIELYRSKHLTRQMFDLVESEIVRRLS